MYSLTQPTRGTERHRVVIVGTQTEDRVDEIAGLLTQTEVQVDVVTSLINLVRLLKRLEQGERPDLIAVGRKIGGFAGRMSSVSLLLDQTEQMVGLEQANALLGIALLKYDLRATTIETVSDQIATRFRANPHSL